MFTVNINNKQIQLEKKTRILDLIEGNTKQYFAAKVNNRLRELTYEASFDCSIELLTLNDYDAIKVYEATLRYIISMAFYNLYPTYSIRISYNIARSLMISILSPNNVIIDNDLINNVKKEMDRIIKEDIVFEKLVLSTEETKKYFAEHNESNKDILLQYRPEKTCHLIKCKDYINYMYCYLTPSTGYIHDYKMFVYSGEIIVQYPRHEYNGKIPTFIDEPVLSTSLRKAYLWSKVANAEVVSKINKHITEDTYVDFINMNETLHNNMLCELGNKIEKNIDNIKLICIAGPSSSGKTTFSNRLRIELLTRNIRPLRISLDMYYKPKDQCPVDEDGNPDYEHIESLDVDLFNQHLQDLINGKEVTLPYFDFETGRLLEGQTIKIDSKTPIIIEGIHALNDRLSYSIAKSQKFKIYIAPMFQINLDNHNPISYTDIRLIRRIVRDQKYRGTSAEDTIQMWSSVRRGEFRWIYPFQEECNFIYNSALTYELCVLKKYALPSLQKIPSDSPSYIMANRLIKYLKYFKDMDDKFVPCNSLLREFIGGSCFADVEE